MDEIALGNEVVRRFRFGESTSHIAECSTLEGSTFGPLTVDEVEELIRRYMKAVDPDEPL